jgi:DNA-binding PadR family transcriptional regulator
MSDPTMLVLASLAGGAKHGYAMMEDIESFSGLKLGPGTLYGAITRLEERGWIAASASDDRRKPYKLTALGRKNFEQEMVLLERFVKAGSRRLKPA